MQKVSDISQQNITVRQLRQLVDSRPVRPSRQMLTSTVKAVPDWEKSWSDTVRKAKEGLPKVDERPVQSAPRFANQDSQSKMEQDYQLLNFFTQESSFQVGGGIVVGLLAVFALAGPP